MSDKGAKTRAPKNRHALKGGGQRRGTSRQVRESNDSKSKNKKGELLVGTTEKREQNSVC